MRDDVALTIAPRCHPRAPLRAHMTHAGELVLSCWECARPVLRPGSLPDPDRKLARLICIVAGGAFAAVIALVIALQRA